MSDTIVDYEQFDHALRASGSNWNAGQAHGLLCSRLSIAGGEGISRWLGQILEDAAEGIAEDQELHRLLEAVYSTTWRQLVERQSEFELLLPGDDETTQDRADALAQWCEGFLHGLVSEKHGDALKERLAAEPIADVIRDMLQITRATAGDESAEEIETAYSDLVEYLRVAVQLTYEELADFRPDDVAATAGNADTVH